MERVVGEGEQEMNMAGTPLKITLYDPETNEVVKEFTRVFIPWKILKAAVRLVKSLKSLDPTALDEGDVDAIASLVVEVFGNQFTIDQLDGGVDLEEMLAVLNGILARAGMAMGNPTNLPPPTP